MNGAMTNGRDQEIAPTRRDTIAIRRSLLQEEIRSRFGDRSYNVRGVMNGAMTNGRDQEIAPTRRDTIAIRRSLLQEEGKERTKRLTQLDDAMDDASTADTLPVL